MACIAVQEAMRFLLSHLKVAFEITGDMQRNEISEYPVMALRELLLNAVVHRDYTSPVDIQIKIFDQAITLFNPGRLYGNLTIDQLRTDSYQSRTCNKLIAEAFYLTRDIEKYGSGYIRVREAIADYPTMQFDYEESGDGYLVTLSYQEQKTTQKTTRGQILSLLLSNPKMTRETLAGEIGVTPEAIKQQLSKLKAEGLIERKGGRKMGYWIVNQVEGGENR